MEENKMKINVKIEVHCYQQDRLIDETFEAASMMILGTEAASCVKKIGVLNSPLIIIRKLHCLILEERF